MFGINYFGVVDYIIVAGTLSFSIGIGLYHAVTGNKTNEDILVGGRSMRPIPIAISMLVTYLSAITILGYPAEIYAHGIQIFMMSLLFLLAIPVSVVLFVKPFYEMKLTSIYGYLENRFDSFFVRILASFTFVVQIMLWNAIMLYAPAIALETIVGMPVWLSITGLGIIGTIYTSFGGIKAVVWTDCFQFVMIAVGMLTMIFRGFTSAGGVVRAFNIAGEKGRLNLFDFNIDPFQRHNFWNMLLGLGFAMTTSFGTHQPQVQRYCSLPSMKHAVRAMLLVIPMNLFTMGLVLLTGISIFATYAKCCPILLGKVKKVDSIAPYFVVNEIADLPGLMGIFVSCVFSAVLSSFSSTLNSLAAVTWEDVISKIPKCSGMGSTQQANWLKVIAIVYGILSILLSFGAQYSGQIFQASMTAYGATSGPLGGIFVCALFLPCVNKWGAITGTLTGLVVMFYIGISALFLPKGIIDFGTDVDGCPNGTDFSAMIAKNLTTGGLDFDWPEKIFTLSYTLYSVLGALITVFVGLIVGVLSGGLKSRHKVPEKYLHPMLRTARTNRPVQNQRTEYPYGYDVVGDKKMNGRDLGSK